MSRYTLVTHCFSIPHMIITDGNYHIVFKLSSLIDTNKLDNQAIKKTKMRLKTLVYDI